MNYLELCQELRREAGLSGSGPSAVTAQSGMYEKIVGWVAEAYREILKMHPWQFAWARGTGTLVDGTADYTSITGITQLGRIYRTTVRDMTSTGQPYLSFMTWPYFDRLDATEEGAPRIFTRRPDGAIVFWPTPDAAYSIRMDYQKDGHALAGNTDNPLIPDTSLHKVIVYKALTYYGLHDENASAIQHGERQFWMLIGQMADRYLPRLVAQPRPLDEPEDAITPELV